MRSFPALRELGSVVFDVTHSVQRRAASAIVPGASVTSSTRWLRRGGRGVHGLFMEVHENPDRALSDGPNCTAWAG
jgi:2-dehydro-3-deoxyphosphooctonate aldolase (KDO 8-P synthase)